MLRHKTTEQKWWIYSFVFALKRGDACETKVNISLKTKVWPIGMHVWCCIYTGSVDHSLDQLWASIHLSGIHAAIFIIIMFQILQIAVHPDAYSISESETLYHKLTDILQRSSIMWKAPVILVIFNCILSCNLNLNQLNENTGNILLDETFTCIGE